jgi:GT2 family glycosyltransferase
MLNISHLGSKETIEAKIAVMILNFNGKHLLEKCLNSVLKTNYPSFEVFVIDNSSTDDSVKFIKEHYPMVKIIAFDSNYGFCKAYNMAIASVGHPYIAFLNNDTEVDPGWLKELADSMFANKSVAIAGSKLLIFNNRSRLDHAGTVISPIGGGFKIGFLCKDEEDFNHKSFSAAACGASMLVKSDVFRKLCGLDELFYAYSEDLDLGWRSWLYGYEVLYVPQSIVYHMLGASWGSSFDGSTSPKKVFFIHRNMLITSIKNFDFTNLFFALIFHFAFSFFKTLLYLRRRLPRHSLSVMRVYYWVLLNVKTLVKKRRCIQKNRVVQDSFLKKKGLILSWSDSFREFRRLLKIEGP